MNHLEQRKRALVAESDGYRQMLNLEIQNLRLSGLGLGQKINQYRGLILIPLVGSLVGMLSGGLFGKRRKRGWRQLLGIGILGWRLYRKFGPFLQSGLAQWLARKPTASSRAEEQTPAANI